MKKILFDFWNVIYFRDYGLNIELITFLELLYSRGYELCLFTNTRSDFIEEVDANIPFLKFFSRVIYCEQYRKPDIRAYENLEKELECKFEDMIFVDDEKENILVAESFGIMGVLFENTERTKLKLDEILKHDI